MRRALLLPLALSLAAPAHADGGPAPLTGPWRVSGSILGHAFVLDCRFAGNGGACTETGEGGEGHAGKVHPLTRAAQSGNQVTWSYPTSAMFMKFDMVFAGTLTGNAITGTATAMGRKGSFTATRSR